jgi:hypothetical protein
MARGSSRLNVVLVAMVVLLLGAGLAIRWRIRQLEPSPEAVARVQAPQPSPSGERADGFIADPLNEQAYVVLTRQNPRAVVHPLDGATLYARAGDWPAWLAAIARGAAIVRRQPPSK